MRVRWLAAVTGVLLLMGIIPLSMEAHGQKWSGTDPRLEVNGQQLNVRVEWRRGYACDISGPIDVRIVLPAGSEYTFIGESADRFDCDGDGFYDTVVATNTFDFVG